MSGLPQSLSKSQGLNLIATALAPYQNKARCGITFAELFFRLSLLAKLNLPLLLAGLGLVLFMALASAPLVIRASAHRSQFEPQQISRHYAPQNVLLSAQGNSLLPASNLPQPLVVQNMEVLVTAYSSSPEETDNTPFLTAAGTPTRSGVIASNLLPFGTKLRLPEVFGDKIFVVEDRMNRSKHRYQMDVWFASKEEALNFGVQTTRAEIIEEI